MKTFRPHFSITASMKKKLEVIEKLKKRAKRPLNLKKVQKIARKREIDIFKQMEEISPDKHELTGYLAAYDTVMNCKDINCKKAK